MRTYNLVIIVLVIFALSLSACNLPRSTPTVDPGSPGLVNTYAAQTVEALGTQLAFVTPTTGPAAETPNPTSSQPQEGVTATLAPVAATATLGQVVTNTPAAPTTTSVPCDRMRFIKDVSVPDGTLYAPGAAFTKTWELENAGSCTWNSSYALVFANEGNAMGGPASKPLTSGTVPPGQRVQISVDLKAPTAPGSYRGYWTLRNAAGVLFASGGQDKGFYVDIKVQGVTYNFVEKFCSAEWRSGAGVLACPGGTSDANGFVVRVDNPQFGNRGEDESALWMNPQAVDNGEIRATFPVITISSGSKFRGYLGCQKDAANCDVKFLINYKVDGGAEQTLKEFGATINSFVSLETDLTSLAGKNVQFILIVRANGAMNQDQALLLQPRIE